MLFLGDFERERDLERDCLGFEPDFERDLERDLFRRGLLERERLSCFLGDRELLRRVLRGERERDRERRRGDLECERRPLKKTKGKYYKIALIVVHNFLTGKVSIRYSCL